MNRKKFYILYYIAILSNVLLAQQTTVYTNFLLNAFSYNPAIAGSTEGTSVNMFYRNQWLGFSNDAPQTMLMNVYSSLKKRPQMAFGGQILNDKLGLLNKTMTHLTYAYHINLNSNLKLGLGVSAGMSQIRVRLYDVKMYDKGDELLTGTILNANAFDANAGLLLYSKKFFLGLSSLSLISTKYNYSNAIGKNVAVYNISCGYNFNVHKDIQIQPLVLIKHSAPVPYQPEYMLKIQWKEIFWIGGAYRTYSNASFLFGLNALNNKLKFGYAYDYSVNSIQKYNSGSHEIFVGFYFKGKEKSKDEEEFIIPDNSIKQSIKNKKNNNNDKNN